MGNHMNPSQTLNTCTRPIINYLSFSNCLSVPLPPSPSSPRWYQQGVLQHRWMVRHCGAPAALPDIAVSSGTTAAQPFTPVAAAPSSQPPSEQSKSAQPTAVASAVVASEGTVHKEKKGADVSLASAQVQMKKFNARRKFRVSVGR